MSSSLFFKIKTIRIDGLTSYDAAEVEKNMGFAIDDNIFLINKTMAARNLMAKYPYIESLRIKRDLPGTVSVMVTQAEALGMIEYQGAYWLISERGVLLESVPLSPRPEACLIKGIDLQEAVLGTSIHLEKKDVRKKELLLELIGLLNNLGAMGEIAMIDVSLVSSIAFRYQNRFDIELGFPERLDHKIEFMIAAIERLDEQLPGAKGKLDLSGANERERVEFTPE
ncbi:MAG: FtsQ-type POTRA domain-containing protein [Oscillospiraceae bacterium]|nr:FtsQ-type POTRA domain-containing protein [Oscillospiraceae bacterium]